MALTPEKGAQARVPVPRSGSADGEVGGFPGGEAAGEFGDVGEAGALEQAGGDGGAVAAGAVDEDFAVAGHVSRFFNEMI